MSEILIIKTGALGDVLRTTAILPGLKQRYPEARVRWMTAKAALDLVRHHPLVDDAVAVEVSTDPESGDERVQLVEGGMSAGPFVRLLSLDDELPLCGLAAYLAAPAKHPGVLSGAYLDEQAQRRYTDDVAPWFDMGLLSRFGKERADALKVANERSQPAIYADMFGIEMGEPELPIDAESLRYGERFAAEHGIERDRSWIGLNTGAGGRWHSKRLPEERVAAIVGELHAKLSGRVGFVLLGGPEERERNDRILELCAAGAGAGARVVDAGTDHPLLEFAAIVDRLDLLLTSDSLALHVAVARRVPVVAFFAPTSAAEIELYGRGEKVVSTSPDYCSYQREADTSSLTVERIAAAVLRQLEA